jgi:hypothetical protein
MRHIFTNLIVAAASVGVVACGNSSSEDEVALSAELDGPEAVVNVSFRYGAAEFVVTGAGDAEFVLGWVQFDGTTSVSLIARRYGTALQPNGSDLVLAGPTSRALVNLSACGRIDGGYSMAWGEVTTAEGNGFASNVLGDDGTSGAFRVHPNEIGRQKPTDIACLPDGDAAVVWTNRCEATPSECATEPANGSYVRVFSAVGEPIAPTQDVVIGQGPYQYAWLAPTGENGFALMTGTLLETRDSQGRRIASATTTRGPGLEGKLECPIDAACVGLFSNDDVGVHVQWFDPRSFDGAIDVEVAPVSREAPRVRVIPRTPSIACDADGQCLIVWLAQRETRFSDYFENESLGIDARIMDARTGVLGPTTRLVTTDAGFWGRPEVATFGERRFILAYDVADTIVLHTVVATNGS